MAWTRSTRIIFMIVLDSLFLVLELSMGYYVGSLALIADGFHMLNDIISLGVGLWAVIVAGRETTAEYSYGWLRADILGAFANAIFLIALCVTILLDSVERFFDPPIISNPEIILIVGCTGFLSNILGVFVLGGHGHSHGHSDHDHDHGHESDGHRHEHNPDRHLGELREVEEGLANTEANGHGPADEGGRVADLLPEAVVAAYNSGRPGPDAGQHVSFHTQDSARDGTRSGTLERRTSAQSRGRQPRRTSSQRHGRFASVDDIRIYPSSFRQDIQQIATRQSPGGDEGGWGTDGSMDENTLDGADATESTPLMVEEAVDATGTTSGHDAHGAAQTVSGRPRRDSALHVSHHHNKPKTTTKGHGHGHGHGHSHGMRAMILHVIGDMLGNIGVIVTAAIIWKTDWTYKYYADPATSLLIACIILYTAIPLTLSTSKILLQAVPDRIDINEIREDIQDLPGVRSCHHIHVWQLSDAKFVASMHIEVSFPISEDSGEKYMALAKRARKCLHAYGIHSATIQPEFRVDTRGHDLAHLASIHMDGSGSGPRCGKDQEDVCLLECVDDCVGQGCCSMGSRTASPPGSSHSARSGLLHEGDHDG